MKKATRKIWIAVACVLVIAVLAVPMALLAEQVRYSKVYFSCNLFPALGNGSEYIVEVKITDQKPPATTTFRDADLIATLEQAFDGLVFREARKSDGSSVGTSNSVLIQTSWDSEIIFSYTTYSITVDGRLYLCNTRILSDTLDELFDLSSERNGVQKLT